ncbi:nbas protein [Moniliophthora roreri]|uniref:Sec39 domain-containing protein n=1 Tax=Moniliophthora roreri TaxID=221103 RepID=A0A0W0FH07_MONRR|nr:nbas protein [Moniliophthora roreri]
MTSLLYSRWNDLADSELTVNDVESILNHIPDDLWVAAACADRLVDDVETQRILLQTGISRTDATFERVKRLLPSASESSTNSFSNSADPLTEYFREVESDALLSRLRSILLRRLDCLSTYVELCKEAPGEAVEEDHDENNLGVEEWDDDPWGDGGAGPTSTSKVKLSPPFTLSQFLSNDLLQSSCLLAVNQWFDGVGLMLNRHGAELWPFRYAILDFIPGHANPSDYHVLLPSCDSDSGMEVKPSFSKWRVEQDWSESLVVRTALAILPIPPSLGSLLSPSTPYTSSFTEPRSVGEISAWYQQRVETIISLTGMVDSALTLVQHGGSQGISGLDELGEELSLFSRLVYDSVHAEEPAEDWTLSQWRSMDPTAIVDAYLSNSTPDTVATDISRLVMPYLFVLESRAERAGNPDPSLPSRMLYDYTLKAPLDIVAAIFDASKPTLPFSQRLIKQDDDMVRLALACLYGSNSLNQWPTMSSIFECLPVWDVPSDDEDAADTTVASLGTFVKPTTSRPRCTPSDLLVFFKPLPLSSLSRALDILDVHLESGEILARWSVPAPLRWFLQSNNDASEQRAWANRMARRAGGSEDRLSTQEDWEWLLEDMLKLAGRGNDKIGGAFCLLSKDEVMRIYLSGLLSTGRFDIARHLFHSRKKLLTLDNDTIEATCLSCSREFYDNASSGNYKFGDMKLAYDCLDVPAPSEALAKEKDFIEATSRLCSFNVMSRPGIPISPIEIRLTKDRLSLVSQVLSSNSDAYRHTEVILELVHKLGFKDDVIAEVKTLAMLADTALQVEDFNRSYEISGRMIDLVLGLRATSMGLDNPKTREASDVCWVACFQLGRQTEFGDTIKKLRLLGRAIEICPADRLHDVLTAWRRLEKDDVDAREERLTHRHGGAVERQSHKRMDAAKLLSPESAASSLQARLKNFHMPSPPLLNTPDAAALASRTFKSVTANFPFSRGRSHLSQQGRSERSRSGSRRPENGEDVSTQASKVFSKGIGWLIGAEESI